MAKRAKASEAEVESGGISGDDLKRVIEEASRQKALSAEYAGNHGSVVKNACERYGLEKTAFTFARRLRDMEDGKRQGVIRALLDYGEKLGFFDQIDVFDDTVGTLRRIVERAEGTASAAPEPDAPVDDFDAAAPAAKPARKRGKAGLSVVDSILN